MRILVEAGLLASPTLMGVLLPYGLQGNNIQLLICATVAALFLRAEGC